MLIAVCSLKSSPGVTTLATGIAACWPQPGEALLVEADPAGGDLGARFGLSDSPNLVSLAAATRRNHEPRAMVEHSQVLSGDIRAVTAPVGPEQAGAAIAALAEPLRRAADRPGNAVIVDCGRIGAASPVLDILRCADAMLLVTRAHDDELAHVVQRLPAASNWSPRPCLVVVGKGRTTWEVSTSVGVPVLVRIPHDPKGAAVLGGHFDLRYSPDRSRIGRTTANLAAFLATWPPAAHAQFRRALEGRLVGADPAAPVTTLNGSTR